MSTAALFIDLPNFYSRLLKCGIGKEKDVFDYFANWLDFDLLAKKLCDTNLGIWIFHSHKVGPTNYRLENSAFNDYIRRIDKLPGITSRNVNVPGDQREPISYTCPNCQHKGKTEALSEKGIDTSLAAHLFDTMDSWDIAYLLSGDADFVPIVASLRRRGKIVNGVGFADAASALVKECFQYIDIIDLYIKQDFLVYSLFKEGGFLEEWLCNEVIGDPKIVDLSAEFSFVLERAPKLNSLSLIEPSITYSLTIEAAGPVDMQGRKELITKFFEKYPEMIVSIAGQPDRRFWIKELDILSIEGLLRRRKSLSESFEKIGVRVSFSDAGAGMAADYQRSDVTSPFKLLKIGGV